jgi:hypothetical protein
MDCNGCCKLALHALTQSQLQACMHYALNHCHQKQPLLQLRTQASSANHSLCITCMTTAPAHQTT